MKIALSRIIRKGQKTSQLIIAFVGSVIGLLMLVGSIQLYLDYTSVMFGGEDLLKDGFLINKRIVVANTISGTTATFTEREVEELEESDFVDQLAPVISTKFKIGFSMDKMKGMENFLFHYFAQAVPNEFLKIENDAFTWDEGEDVVPMIVPSEFLAAYNNFAPSQGTPQISEDFLNQFELKLIAEGNGYKDVYRGRIVGFTGKMNTTLLLPYNFLEWANKKYGDAEKLDDIQSLFVISNSKYHHEFVQLMKKNNYAVNEAKLEASEEKSKVNIILSVLLVIGTVILIQAALNFILYSQLSIHKNEYEIGVLTNMGYDYKTISRTYILYFSLIFIVITLTAFFLAILGKMFLNSYMAERNIPLEGLLNPYTYLLGLGFVLIYVVVNSLSIRKSIKEIAQRN